jgi:hypothetical protein
MSPLGYKRPSEGGANHGSNTPASGTLRFENRRLPGELIILVIFTTATH